MKLYKKKKAGGLEIVPKEAESEVQLPENRRSDDKPLKKVNICYPFIERESTFIISIHFRKNGSIDNEFWCSVDEASISATVTS